MLRRRRTCPRQIFSVTSEPAEWTNTDKMLNFEHSSIKLCMQMYCVDTLLLHPPAVLPFLSAPQGFLGCSYVVVSQTCSALLMRNDHGAFHWLHVTWCSSGRLLNKLEIHSAFIFRIDHIIGQTRLQVQHCQCVSSSTKHKHRFTLSVYVLNFSVLQLFMLTVATERNVYKILHHSSLPTCVCVCWWCTPLDRSELNCHR